MAMTAEPTRTKITTDTATRQGADVATWSELVKAVDANDGVSLIPMETLRRLEGAQRLGVHVLKSIGDRLGTLGLGHMPDTLPNRQDQEAILYRYGTPASEVISAIRNGLKSVQDVRNTYHALHKLNTLPEMTEVVHREELAQKLSTATEALVGLMGETGRTGLMNDMLGQLKTGR